MSTLTPTTRRASPLERRPNPSPCVLDDRKIALLRALGRDRFLTTSQLGQIDGGSRQNVQRILCLLFDHGLVRRKRKRLLIVDQDDKHENFPLIYSLTHAGAQVLADIDHAPIRDYNWTTTTKRRKAEHINHATDIADVMRAFRKTVCERGWSLLDHRELIPTFPARTRAAVRGKSPFSLSIELEAERVETPALEMSPAQLPRARVVRRQRPPLKIGVIPDRLFSPRPPGKRYNFALELDEGTMPVFRWKNEKNKLIDFEETSIVRKLLVYYQAWQDDLHVERWGFQQFRVLFVTPTPERIPEMLKAVKFVTKGKGAGLFLFTDFPLLDANNPFAPIWIDGYGEITALLPELQNAPVNPRLKPPER